MPCYSPLKGYKDEETGGITFRRGGTRETMEVACGQCLGCRLDRSRMWAMRLTHEASLHDDTNGNSFITLTYRNRENCTRQQLEDNQFIPDNWSLSAPVRDVNGKQTKSSHFQAFIKRLRKELGDQKIKYYQAGEYSPTCRHGLDLDKQKCPLCNLGRPHHHACLFNVTFPDLEESHRDGDTIRYTSKILEDLWTYGNVDVGKVEFKSAAYVARYIMKKVTGVNAHDHYQNISDMGEVQTICPEYSSMSNGIGKTFYEKYKADFFPSDEVPIPGEGVIKKVPRYYEEQYKQSDPNDHEEIKKNRIRYRNDNINEYTAERLHSKYKVKKAQTTTLLNRG